MVEELRIDFYFADVYSSCQRERNENAKGLLREYFQKKTDLATISEEELTTALDGINQRSRKCLGYKTAYEAFMGEIQ